MAGSLLNLRLGMAERSLLTNEAAQLKAKRVAGPRAAFVPGATELSTQDLLQRDMRRRENAALARPFGTIFASRPTIVSAG